MRWLRAKLFDYEEAKKVKKIADIRKNSPILREMEANGEIKIAGGMYDMDTGEVSFFEK